MFLSVYLNIKIFIEIDIHFCIKKEGGIFVVLILCTNSTRMAVVGGYRGSSEESFRTEIVQGS